MSLISLTWERLDDDHEYGVMFRTRVPGGWLVRVDTTALNFEEQNEKALGVAMTFVPDPNHDWGSGRGFY